MAVAAEPLKLNLGCGKQPRPGYVNVDKFAMPGVDQQVDLFRYPWPWPDNCASEVYSSHLIEHIPHEPWPSDPDRSAAFDHYARWRELEGLDGFFCFFAEIWRVCQPGARVHLVAPFGYTRGAMQDPTHTRFIVPPTFSYLTAEENPNFDYHLPFRFKLLDVGMVVPDPQFNQLPDGQLNQLLSHQWDIATDLVARLEVVK